MRKQVYFQSMRKSAKYLFGLTAVVVFISPPLLHNVMGINVSPILSNSMKPFASAGDLFLTRDVPAAELKVGDIVTVNSESMGGKYAHRIVSITEANGLRELVTKGDGNSTPERERVLLSPNQIIPKEFSHIPWLGRPVLYLSSQSGRSMGFTLLITANILALFAFAFKERKAIFSTAASVYRGLYKDEHEKKVFADKSGDTYKSLYEDERKKREALERRVAGKRSYIFAEDSEPLNYQQ